MRGDTGALGKFLRRILYGEGSSASPPPVQPPKTPRVKVAKQVRVVTPTPVTVAPSRQNAASGPNNENNNENENSDEEPPPSQVKPTGERAVVAGAKAAATAAASAAASAAATIKSAFGATRTAARRLNGLGRTTARATKPNVEASTEVTKGPNSAILGTARRFFGATVQAGKTAKNAAKSATKRLNRLGSTFRNKASAIKGALSDNLLKRQYYKNIQIYKKLDSGLGRVPAERAAALERLTNETYDQLRGKIGKFDYDKEKGRFAADPIYAEYKKKEKIAATADLQKDYEEDLKIYRYRPKPGESDEVKKKHTNALERILGDKYDEIKNIVGANKYNDNKEKGRNSFEGRKIEEARREIVENLQKDYEEDLKIYTNKPAPEDSDEIKNKKRNALERILGNKYDELRNIVGANIYDDNKKKGREMYTRIEEEIEVNDTGREIRKYTKSSLFDKQTNQNMTNAQKQKLSNIAKDENGWASPLNGPPVVAAPANNVAARRNLRARAADRRAAEAGRVASAPAPANNVATRRNLRAQAADRRAAEAGRVASAPAPAPATRRRPRGLGYGNPRGLRRSQTSSASAAPAAPANDPAPLAGAPAPANAPAAPANAPAPANALAPANVPAPANAPAPAANAPANAPAPPEAPSRPGSAAPPPPSGPAPNRIRAPASARAAAISAELGEGIGEATLGLDAPPASAPAPALAVAAVRPSPRSQFRASQGSAAAALAAALKRGAEKGGHNMASRGARPPSAAARAAAAARHAVRKGGARKTQKRPSKSFRKKRRTQKAR